MSGDIGLKGLTDGGEAVSGDTGLRGVTDGGEAVSGDIGLLGLTDGVEVLIPVVRDGIVLRVVVS